MPENKQYQFKMRNTFRYRVSVFSILLVALLSGCASGRLDVYDDKGNIIGECTGQYDWHFYGVRDSVNYILHVCAQQAITNGYHIKDQTILNTDFTLPESPNGQRWNKALAMSQFYDDQITKRQLGYVLSAIEYEYFLKERDAEEKLEKGEITQAEFNEIIEDAKRIWYGE